ncbi:MAG TPA: hypothetical protein VK158_03830 [Acidobacteriota bacterium]|nr:hypothetical protein [Acidobacteriota bacterium]
MAKKKEDTEKQVKISKAHIEDIVTKGGVLFYAVHEIVGKPKEHVDETLKVFIDAMKKNNKYTLCEETLHDAVALENSDSLFSAFVETKVLVNNLSIVYDYIFEYMPASVEIEQPEELTLRSADATGIMNDFAARLHQIDMHAKKLNQKNKVLSQGISTIVHNMIIISLRLGPMNNKQLSKLTGLDETQLPGICDQLIKEKKVVKNGEIYELANSAKKKLQ